MKPSIFGLFLLFHLNTGFSQVVKGTITDDSKHPIPFATVYIENLQTGTMANINGVYEINLQPGKYKLNFRSLGYKPVNKTVELQNSPVTLDITLVTQAFMVKEVTITPNGEDFAYSIMRKVIAWSNFHLNQVSHYQSDVYLKGRLSIENIPKLMEKFTAADINGQKIKMKSGQTFVSESINEITFEAPDVYHQKVKSSQSSFPIDDSKQGSPMGYVQTSFYDPAILGGISPLSPQAFSHYKFVYEGFSQDGDNIIDKIKVIPRRQSQQLFEGYIYIVEQYWCLYSVDLSNSQFWGKANIKQLFSPVKNDAWLPVTHNFLVDASIMGFKAEFSYVASVKYNDIKINEKLSGPIPVEKEKNPIVNERKKLQGEAEIEQLASKDKLSYSDMRKLLRAARKEEKLAKADTAESRQIIDTKHYTIERDAVKRDSQYWSISRPVPLTLQEIKSYQKKDSLLLVQKSKASHDSISSVKKGKFKPLKQLAFGRTWFLGDSSLNIRYYGLLNPAYFWFNTVDGWVYNQKLNFTWNMDSVHSLTISPRVGYAFNRKAWMGNIDGNFKYAPLSRGKFSFGAGHYSSDYNQESGINKHINSIASLFFRRNYMKLFDNRYIYLKNEIDLANGLQLKTDAKYFEPTNLGNNSDYSFFYKESRFYTSNVPNNAYFPQAKDSISTYKSTAVTVGLSYTPKSYYRIVKGAKQTVPSKYPTFYANYTRGLTGILGSNSSYQHINTGLDHFISLRNQASFDYMLSYGKFFDVNRIHFSEFKHLSTQPLPVTVSGFDKSFQLLDFYKNSTDDQYIEGHFHYKSRFLFLKRLPIISKRIWTENLFVNYFNTSSLHNYVEVGYGLGNIAALGNLGVFVSFEDGKYQSTGVKVSFDIAK